MAVDSRILIPVLAVAGIGALFLMGGEAKAAGTSGGGGTPPVPPVPKPPGTPPGGEAVPPVPTSLPVDPTIDPKTGLRLRPVLGTSTPSAFALKWSGNGERWKELLAVNPDFVVKQFADNTGKTYVASDGKTYPVMYQGIFLKSNGAAWGSPQFPPAILIPASWKG